jgi:hypothetical protein
MDIICINDNFTPEQMADIPNRPQEGQIYTIRDVVKSQNGVGLLLNEVQNPHNGWTIRNGMKFTFEPNFSQTRFTTLLGESLTEEYFAKKTVTC